MKQALLLTTLSIGLLTSCSTAYKATQTPDDVYYSPGRNIAAAKEEESAKQDQQYQEYTSSLDDRYLRMKVANRSRWSQLDNFDYWYDSRYDFGSYNYYTSNPYTSWNPAWNTGIGYDYYCRGGGIGWTSPLYTLVYYTNPFYKGGGSNAGSNITAYKNKNYNNTNYGYKDPKTGAFVPASSSSGFGNLLKRVFTSSDNTASYDRPVRSFSNPTNTSTPAPATSSSAGGSSGGFHSTGSSSSSGRGGKG